jgi:hypothetical protein
MAEYEKKVRPVLRDYGCYFLCHGKGDHDIMKQAGINYHF